MNYKVFAKELEYFSITPPSVKQKTVISMLTDSISINSKNIDITGTTSGINNSIDLLFYNKVNNVGTIVSSLVYIGNIYASGTDRFINFTPSAMFGDTYNFTEISQSVACNRNFSFYNSERAIGKQASAFSTIPKEYIDTKALTNIVGNTAVLDGWYTVITTGITNEISAQNGFADGALYSQGNSINTLLVQHNNVYIPVFKPTTELNIFSKYVTTTSISDTSYKIPKFIRQEIFVLNNFSQVYNKLMKHDKNINIIKKFRLSAEAIMGAASAGNFDTAQLLIQYILKMQSRLINY